MLDKTNMRTLANKATAKAKTEDNEKTQAAVIARPNLQIATVTIRGNAPYVQNKMSQRNIENMIAAQMAGSQDKKKTKKKDPKDFDAAYRGAMHISREGWHGIPAAAFRQGMIDACRAVDYVMTRAKMFLFVVADGYDREDGQPLVRIIGEPHMFLMTVRLPSGATDVAARPMFDEWSAKLTLKWDGDALSGNDVVNLLARAGFHCGVGAGRPFSKDSAGMGWGTFEVEG